MFLKSALATTIMLSGTLQNGVAKHGISFPWDSNPNDFVQFNAQNCPKAAWYQNWEGWTFAVPNNLKQIATCRTKDDIGKLYQFLPSSGAQWLLMFNEPDLPGGTQLDVGSAVALWRQHAIHFRNSQGTKLISPAITSDQSKGLPWIRNFMSQVRDCPPNAMALHWYGKSGTEFKNYVQSVYNEFRLPIFVHEVASTDTYIASVNGFMGDIMTWADQQPWILGIFWFCASRNANINEGMPLSALLDRNGQRTDLGWRYCNL